MAVSAGDAASRTKAPAISTCAPASPAAASPSPAAAAPSPAAASPSALVLAKPAGASHASCRSRPARPGIGARVLRASARHVHQLAFRDHRFHGTAHHRGRPEWRGDHAVGLHRLHLVVNAGHARLRQAGRSYRPQAPAHGGARPIRSGQDDLRPIGEHGHADQWSPRLRAGGRRPYHPVSGDAL